MRIRFHLIGLLFAGLLISAGCAGSGDPGFPTVPANDTNPVLASGQTDTRSPQRHLWSYNEIRIDPETLEFEVLPARQVADHWNVLLWLEQGPCTNCFKVHSITGTPKGTLQVSAEILHPFPSPTLTGFDVRGIAMAHGTHTFPNSGLVTSDRLFNEGQLVNADGFTTLYNPTTMGAGPGGLQGYIQGVRATIPYPNTTLNGYKRLTSPGDENTRNAFYAGSSVETIFEIFKPTTAFILGYAVDASWVPPATTPVVNPMTDFPPNANCSEPWKIDVTETPVGLGLTSSGGEVVLQLDIYDYQGKLTHYVPSLECPELFNGVLYATYKSSESTHSTFEITIANQNLAPDGSYKCLITVEDLDNDTAPEWLDITAYLVHELGVGLTAPPNVEGFQVSDADPTLDNRKVRLTWEAGNDYVEWYDIERMDYDYDTGWFWKPVKSQPHPLTEWTDGNPRYCGWRNPIQYRISARNEAGTSPGYATDTGYPLPREFGMALWCAADDTSGTNPATTWARANQDFGYCNDFWNQYGMVFVLQNPGDFFWVGVPEYKDLSGGEAEPMHESHGKSQQPGSINVYYVNTADGDPARAYCIAMCPGEYHTTENIMIVMAKDSSGAPPKTQITLAHENGHAVGRFYDIYNLDTNHDMVLNDGATCANTNTWCNNPPWEDPVLFCDDNAGYASQITENPWNLMWYSAPGKPVANYDLTPAQYVYLHDWVHGNKTHYPWP